MRILFLTDGLFPFQIGGMQKHSSVLVKLLSKRGIELVVIHPGGFEFSEERLMNEFDNPGNIKFIHIPLSDKGIIPGHYIRANRTYSKTAFNLVKGELNQFDLIYAQGFTGHYFINRKLSGFHKIPVIVNLHGFEMFQFAPNFKTRLAYLLLKKEAKYNLINADFIYSFGGKLDKILDCLGVSKGKILQHSNGIEDSWIKEQVSSQPVRTFLFIGRNERRKGVNELNAAINVISENENVKFGFHFVGHMDKKDQLNNEFLFYHGELRDTKKLITIIDQCDCLVIPSYAEGMPTVVLEAMARGLTIMGTDVGAVGRMIDGNGILLEKPDSKKIAEAMHQILSMSDERLNVMKRKSLQIVKEIFLWSRVVDEKIKDFRRITEKEN